MSQAPTQTPTARGYHPPSNTQFSIFLDNRVGRLMEVVEVLQNQRLTFAGMSVVDATDHAVVRVLTSDADLARRLINRAELPCSESPVICVELTNDQTLYGICEVLLALELNIYYAYPLMVAPRGLPVIVLGVDDLTLAVNTLRKKHFTLLAENDLGDNAPGSTPGKPTEPTPN
jgi:hypothetical protein